MKKNLKDLPQSYIALFFGLLTLGLSPIFIKVIDAPGIITSFYRFVTGTIVLTIPFLIHILRTHEKPPVRGLIFAVLAGFCFASDMAFWTTGIKYGNNATLPTLTSNMAPLWVGIAAIFIFKEKQKLGFWIGVLLAILGVSLMVFRDFFQSTGLFIGMICGVFSGIFYSVYYLLTQPGRKYLNTITFLYTSTLTSTIVLGIYVIIFRYSFTGYSNHSWLMFIAYGVIVQAGGWFLINYAQGHIPASTVAPTLLGQPVLAGIIEWFLPGGRFTGLHIAGGLIVVAGIYVVHFTRNRNKLMQ